MDKGLKRDAIEDAENWLFYQLAIANVQRQASDFEGASKRLELMGDYTQEDPVMSE